MNHFCSSPPFHSVQIARLSIYFKETQFITSKRSELYGPTDFLANCGGLLGLFMGVSLLSIVEIMYYLTIRLCCRGTKMDKEKVDAATRAVAVERCEVGRIVTKE